MSPAGPRACHHQTGQASRIGKLDEMRGIGIDRLQGSNAAAVAGKPVAPLPQTCDAPQHGLSALAGLERQHVLADGNSSCPCPEWAG
jgi:hypothetical protein